MSLTARRELLTGIRQRYQDASWVNKGKILGGFVAATDYDRKYATRLLNSSEIPTSKQPRSSAHQYNEQVRQALLAVWYALIRAEHYRNLREYPVGRGSSLKASGWFLLA